MLYGQRIWLLSGAKSFAPVSSPSQARHMTTPTAFRILRIRPLLRLNGTIERIETLQAKCGACGDESRMSRGMGLVDVEDGVELTCPACRVTGTLTTDQAWLLWGEQMRQDRILALAGLAPDDLYRP